MFQKKPKSAPLKSDLANRGDYFNNRCYRYFLSMTKLVGRGKNVKRVPLMPREQAWEYAKNEALCVAFSERMGWIKDNPTDNYLLVRG